MEKTIGPCGHSDLTTYVDMRLMCLELQVKWQQRCMETWYMKTSDDESCSEMVSIAMFHAGWGKNKPVQEHRSCLLEE